MSSLFVGLFVVVALGYMLGRVTIKGVNLGTAGVFLVAILFGFLCTLIPGDMPVLGGFKLQAGSANTSYYKTVISNIGLIMFVASVGFIAGPNFFRNLKKNFKTYILLGGIIIATGTLVTILFIWLSPYGSDFWSGILSGALTSTPGYSSAIEAATLKGIPTTLVTVGYAIAYPFGVLGVVLFVQLMPKFLKVDMEKERALLLSTATEHKKDELKLFECDSYGFTAFALAVIAGLVVGAVKIPLPGGASFSLGTTGGVLIMGLVFGHFGRIGKLSLKIPAATTKVLKELGLMLFLIGAGVDGGVQLVSAVKGNADIVVWGFLGGIVMTLAPMVVGFFLAKYLLKLPLLNNLGSITGGMTSTPALGTLISTAKTDDVAGAYASTYPIALVLVVLACNLMVGLI
ncbi:MAG: permease [Clostridia bacterium]|nr:permease [Clostridia bacterium]